MKRFAVFTVLAVIVLSLFGCAEQEISVAGKQYTYEGEGAGSAFTISIYEDGTFSYYEGMFSSYIGIGQWSLEGNVLTLTDDDLYPVISDGAIISARKIVNHFRVEKDALYFIEEDSSNFVYVKVQDGECFYGAPLEESE